MLSDEKLENIKHQHVLCLISSLGVGGAEVQMHELIKVLNSKGIKPSLLTYYPTDTDYLLDIDVNRIAVVESFFVKKYLKVIWYAIKAKPDVILSYCQIPNVLAILISLLSFKKIRVVVSERNTALSYGLLEKIVFNSYRFASVVVPNSLSQTDFFKNHTPYLVNKIKTITNYTSVEKFKFVNKERGNPVKIGILARYHPQKNILLFLESVYELSKTYPTVEFHWYGEKFLDSDGNFTKYSAYYQLCEETKFKYQLEKQVFFHSFSQNAAAEFLKYDAICLPSLFEGFSNTLSEAICCGKPILASAVCDNVLFVKDGLNGFLFNPNDLQDMKNAMEKFLNLSEEQLISFQQESKKLADQLFSKEKFTNDYLNVLFN